MEEYLSLFYEPGYFDVVDSYLKTDTVKRLKNVTQFCGSDYTKLYSPLFLYTRFDHSLAVSMMVYHFTHSKEDTIVALLHDAGTPCFAHVIDFLYGDYEKQETSERKLSDVVKRDKYLMELLYKDNIDVSKLDSLDRYPVLENSSPRLCCDRLDGVLHTVYIWLHTRDINSIRRVYNDMEVIMNEDGKEEIGFKTLSIAREFVGMVLEYARELQSNKDKYIMSYVAELVRVSISRGYISINDLYELPESDIVKLFDKHFPSFKVFQESEELICTDTCPSDNFYVSITSKKRNTIPLMNCGKRITEVDSNIKEIYDMLGEYHDTKYGYVKEIKIVS